MFWGFVLLSAESSSLWLVLANMSSCFFARDTCVKTRDIILFGIGSCFSKLCVFTDQQPCSTLGKKQKHGLVVGRVFSSRFQVKYGSPSVWPWWAVWMGFHQVIFPSPNLNGISTPTNGCTPPCILNLHYWDPGISVVIFGIAKLGVGVMIQRTNRHVCD